MPCCLWKRQKGFCSGASEVSLLLWARCVRASTHSPLSLLKSEREQEISCVRLQLLHVKLSCMCVLTRDDDAFGPGACAGDTFCLMCWPQHPKVCIKRISAENVYDNVVSAKLDAAFFYAELKKSIFLAFVYMSIFILGQKISWNTFSNFVTWEELSKFYYYLLKSY